MTADYSSRQDQRSLQNLQGHRADDTRVTVGMKGRVDVGLGGMEGKGGA